LFPLACADGAHGGIHDRVEGFQYLFQSLIVEFHPIELVFHFFSDACDGGGIELAFAFGQLLLFQCLSLAIPCVIQVGFQASGDAGEGTHDQMPEVGMVTQDLWTQTDAGPQAGTQVAGDIRKEVW